jgi:hypothetical protein
VLNWIVGWNELFVSRIDLRGLVTIQFR